LDICEIAIYVNGFVDAAPNMTNLCVVPSHLLVVSWYPTVVFDYGRAQKKLGLVKGDNGGVLPAGGSTPKAGSHSPTHA
jgi:hypothetical protein